MAYIFLIWFPIWISKIVNCWRYSVFCCWENGVQLWVHTHNGQLSMTDILLQKNVKCLFASFNFSKRRRIIPPTFRLINVHRTYNIHIHVLGHKNQRIIEALYLVFSLSPFDMNDSTYTNVIYVPYVKCLPKKTTAHTHQCNQNAFHCMCDVCVWQSK